MIRIAVFLFGTLLFDVSHAEPIQIVAFGGSNTFGKNVSTSESYPAQLEAMLRAAGYDVTIKNEGTSGQTTADELGKVESSIPKGTRIVIYQPGGNDLKAKNRGIDSKENIKAIVQTLLDRKIFVLLAGNRTQHEYVKGLKIGHVKSIHRMAPDDMQTDGEHLTPKGYKIAAELMLPYVKELLEKVLANDAQPIVPGDASPRSGLRL